MQRKQYSAQFKAKIARLSGEGIENAKILEAYKDAAAKRGALTAAIN